MVPSQLVGRKGAANQYSYKALIVCHPLPLGSNLFNTHFPPPPSLQIFHMACPQVVRQAEITLVKHPPYAAS